MFGRICNIHLVGIGGSGMNGIAEVLVNRGFKVSGSDLAENAAVHRLRGLGATIQIGHDARHVEGAQVVVISSAVAQTNPEVVRAHELKIPVIPRAEMLMELMRSKKGIAIGGAHGKTTTTSLVLSVLGAAGFDPTAVIGGKLNALGSNAKLGQGEYFIAEADESDGSFLRLTPTVAVITNIDREHMNHYGTMEALRKAFADFANSVPFYGATIICLDDEENQNLIPNLKRRIVTYGLNKQAQIRAQILKQEGRMTHFRVFHNDEVLGEASISVPGVHNVVNALAAIAVGLECEVGFEKIARGLKEFSGIERRFHHRGELSLPPADSASARKPRSVLLLDDYAHHPREIVATLNACKDAYPDRRLIVVFQPHRYSRLMDLFGQFATSFFQADVLLLLAVYPAGEDPMRTPGFDHRSLGEEVVKRGYRRDQVRVCEHRPEAISQLKTILQEGDLLVTLGAGDVWKLCEEIKK